MTSEQRAIVKANINHHQQIVYDCDYLPPEMIASHAATAEALRACLAAADQADKPPVVGLTEEERELMVTLSGLVSDMPQSEYRRQTMFDLNNFILRRDPDEYAVVNRDSLACHEEGVRYVVSRISKHSDYFYDVGSEEAGSEFEDWAGRLTEHLDDLAPAINKGTT